MMLHQDSDRAMGQTGGKGMGKDRQDLFGQGIGRQVKIQRRTPDGKVADTAAHQPDLEASLLQQGKRPVHRTRDAHGPVERLHHGLNSFASFA